MPRLAEPAIPSTVALTVTVPAPSPVTRPEDETCASEEPPTDHVAALPLMIAPLMSLAWNVACDVAPTVMLEALNATVTVLTTDVADTAFTVTDMLPVLPEAAAVMVAEPAATAEMSPLPDTVATAALDVVQVNEVPDIVAPFASFATALACVVPPTESVA